MTSNLSPVSAATPASYLFDCRCLWDHFGDWNDWGQGRSVCMSCLSGTAFPGYFQFQAHPAHPLRQEQVSPMYMYYTIHILTICFVRDMTQPPVSTLCSWSSNISACLDRLPIQRGSILLLSTCSIAAIHCCSFFPRNWLSGLQTTML